MNPCTFSSSLYKQKYPEPNQLLLIANLTYLYQKQSHNRQYGPKYFFVVSMYYFLRNSFNILKIFIIFSLIHIDFSTI